jgi:hypothetical protein
MFREFVSSGLFFGKHLTCSLLYSTVATNLIRLEPAKSPQPTKDSYRMYLLHRLYPVIPYCILLAGPERQLMVLRQLRRLSRLK